jgi:hypothetical protein
LSRSSDGWTGYTRKGEGEDYGRSSDTACG